MIYFILGCVYFVLTLHPWSCGLHIPQHQRCFCLHSAPTELRSPHTPASTLSLSALCAHGAAVSTYPSVNVVSVCTLHPRSCGLHIPQRQRCLCLHSAPTELRSPHTSASTLSLSALCTHGAEASTYPSINVVSVCTLHPRS